MNALRASSILVAPLLLIACGGGSAPLPSPASVAEELMATDRRFAEQARSRDLITALGPMFADDVIMPVPGTGFVQGRVEALSALEANPINRGARIEWTPIRVGVSADGQHGFTFGYLTLRTSADSVIPQKYMTYWIRTPQGWRAAGYKRGRSAPGATTAAMPPSLPPRSVAVSADQAAIEAYRASVAQAEQSFSDEAQRIGLGPAFIAYGLPDAVNMGAGSEYLVGAQAIGTAIGEGSTAPSPVSWSSDYRTLVASSGDLGITFGTIRPNTGPAQSFYFFTIWRRDNVNARWKYVAE